jgi:hypothetical protein
MPCPSPPAPVLNSKMGELCASAAMEQSPLKEPCSLHDELQDHWRPLQQHEGVCDDHLSDSTFKTKPPDEKVGKTVEKLEVTETDKREPCSISVNWQRVCGPYDNSQNGPCDYMGLSELIRSSSQSIHWSLTFWQPSGTLRLSAHSDHQAL